MKKPLISILVFFFLFSLSGCRITPEAEQSPTILEESPVQEILLTGLASESRAEISGMAWCDDQHLILLPQYPGWFTQSDEAHVFSVSETQLKDFLSGKSTGAIEPDLISFDQGGLNASLPGFEGFEAIAFIEDRFYTLIETHDKGKMVGYLAMGNVMDDCTQLVIDPSQVVSITPQANLDNMTDETLIIYEGLIHTIYEANGLNVNPKPQVHRFSYELEPEADLPLVTVEYRITDATVPDEAGEFWAINYFYPGDTKLEPATDQIAREFGWGTSHMDAEQVERLVAFNIGAEGITLAGKPPIYLALDGDEARNWEGIVRFEEGFLVVTDKFPTTILAYVAN